MRKVLFLVALALAFGFEPAAAQNPMKFFVPGTAGPPATGARGIEAADEHCQTGGYGAGYGDYQWRAFLDVPAASGRPAVKAVDRIGSGPWYNIEGTYIAGSPADLASGNHNLNRQTAMDPLGFRPFSNQSTAAPEELLKTGAPDARGFYLCFAV